jgi:hypothetical protein
MTVSQRGSSGTSSGGGPRGGILARVPAVQGRDILEELEHEAALALVGAAQEKSRPLDVFAEGRVDGWRVGLEQLGGVHAQDGGQLLDPVQADVFLAALDSAQVLGIEPRPGRQLFLGEPVGFPEEAEAVPKPFPEAVRAHEIGPNGIVGRLGAGVNRTNPSRGIDM